MGEVGYQTLKQTGPKELQKSLESERKTKKWSPRWDKEITTDARKKNTKKKNNTIIRKKVVANFRRIESKVENDYRKTFFVIMFFNLKKYIMHKSLEIFPFILI